ncbi:MAG: hypothetical protein AAGA54_34530 [Myxococcota bacterium]
MADSTSIRVPLFAAVLAVMAAGPAGCFDSDEVFSAPGTTSTGAVDPTTSTTIDEPGSSTSTIDNTTGEPDITCRDAVACIQQCSLDLIVDPGIEPDLGCFLDCEEQLTVREAYHLLRLANCAAAECEQLDACMPDMGSSGGAGSGNDGLLDPCLLCVFGLMTDTEPTVCVEFHELCNEENVE